MKVALIGYGYWGQKIFQTLSKIFSQHNITVVDPELKKDSSDILTNSLASVLKNKLITHVLIATPEETHFKIARQCLQHNKNIFVEKPLCLKKSQAQKLQTLAQTKNLQLYVDYIFLYDPYVKQIKNILQENKLGKLIHINSIRHSTKIKKPHISVFDDLATHDIYLGKYFFGENVSDFDTINEIIQNQQIKQASATYFYNQKTLSAHYSWLQPTSQRIMTFIGSKQSLFWNKHQPNLVLYQNQKPASEVTVDLTTSPLKLSIQNFLNQSKNFQYVEDVALLEKLTLNQ